MNKKKCPKCGEDNPPEAVMCWACYTPLSTPTGVSGAPGAPAGKAAPKQADDEKKKIPPWQMGVIGVALLGGAFIGVRTMMPASSSNGEETETTTTQTKNTDDDSESTGAPSAPSPSAPPITSSAVAPAGSAVPAPQEAPFTVIVPPNPRRAIGTMAIVPTDGTSSGPQAAALAAYTRRLYKGRTKQWTSLYIYVFSDTQSAEYFAAYMKRRRGAALTESDYSYLSTMWNSVLARYEYTTYNGKRVERALYPSKNPGGWWNERASL